MISRSRLAELQRPPPTWKFCAAQSQERFDRANAQSRPSENERPPRFFYCRNWKTTARPRKTLPGSLDRDREKNKRAREEPSPGPPARTERKWKCSEAPFMELCGHCRLPSCVCDSRRLPRCADSATSCPRACVVVPEDHERDHQFRAARPQKLRRGPAAPAAHARARGPARTWIRAAKQIYKLAGNTQLSERALTQRKTRGLGFRV